MKFDKSKIYTSVNADEVKIGSEGYFADSLASLEAAVTNEEASYFSRVHHVNPDENVYRFRPESFDGDFELFYLVDEPEPEEVIAAEWDNKPRIMKVWDDDYSNVTKAKVVYIAPEEAESTYPVVAFISSNGHVEGHMTCYKHCAEIAATKELEASEKVEPKIEEAATDEKSYRPYKNTDEMIEDFKRRCGPYGGWRGKNNPMYCPLVWVVNKYTENKNLITFYSDCRVYIASGLTSLKILFDNFTYLDGSPVGIEE